MSSLNTIQLLAVLVLPVLFAITAHEAAHGWVASLLGDKTASMLGRVTLNPLKHIDPIGTIVVPLVTFLLTGFLFGWARPVPINGRNLRRPRRDMALVALAGPAANLAMAILWGLVAQAGALVMHSSAWVGLFVVLTGASGVLINAFLMALNLFPLLPLDGGRILNALLPRSWSASFSRLEPYGLLILLALLATGFLWAVVLPLVELTIDVAPGTFIVKEVWIHYFSSGR